MKHLVERKSQFPRGMLFLRLAQKQVLIWASILRMSIVIDCWLYIAKSCKEVNISILKQNKSTLWILGEAISGNGISTIGKWKFTILENEIYKDSIFHLSVWLIGQGGWKFCRRAGFDSWQYASQAEKWRWAGSWKILLFQIDALWKNLIFLIF